MSSPTLADAVRVLEGFYPSHTAAEWDRVGLVTGDLEQSVQLVHFAVDPTLSVIEEARDAGADLLVTHHPLLLRGVHSVATTTAKGAAVTTLVVADIALYCAHTNADVATPGVNDALAAACGLPADADSLGDEDGAPLGKVGDLPAPVLLGDYAAALAEVLPAAPAGLRVSGDPDATVRRVAVQGRGRRHPLRRGAPQRRGRLRHGGPATPPGAGSTRRSTRRPAIPDRRGALGDRVAVAGRLRRPVPGGATRTGV